MTASTRSVEQLAEARQLVVSGEARRIRQAAHLSLTDVAAAIGADYSSVGRWERRERIPRGPAALRYARLITRLKAQLDSSVQLSDLTNEDAKCPPAA